MDGRIEGTPAVLDESALTGEPLQVERAVGEPVRSGVVNAGDAFEIRATATAEDEHLRRDRAAGSAGRAPTAHRSFGWPTATRPGSCRWRWWWPARRGWPAGRRCGRWRCWWWRPRVRCCSRRRWRSSPGLSRASRQGVVIRSGGALENLGHATTLVMDKTGTLTAGRPGRRRRPGRARPRRRPRSCDWPRRWISCPRTCWPRRSSPKPWPETCRCRCPPT